MSSSQNWTAAVPMPAPLNHALILERKPAVAVGARLATFGAIWIGSRERTRRPQWVVASRPE